MILGLTGPYGAGKSWVAHYLKEKYGFVVVTLSDFVREELKKKGIPENVNALSKIGSELRARYGPGYLAKRALEFKKKNDIKNIVMDSVVNVSEIEELKNSGEKFHVIRFDGPLEMRWERYNRNRSKEGDMPLEEFILFENSQMEGSKYKQQLLACMEEADGTIFNDGNLDNLKTQIEEEVYQFINEF